MDRSPITTAPSSSSLMPPARRGRPHSAARENGAVLSETHREMVRASVELQGYRNHPRRPRPPVLFELKAPGLKAFRPAHAARTAARPADFDPFQQAVDPRSLSEIDTAELRAIYSGARSGLLRGLHAENLPHEYTPRTIALREPYLRFEQLARASGCSGQLRETMERLREDLDVTEHGELPVQLVEDLDRHEELLFAGIEALERQRRYLRQAEDNQTMGRIAIWTLLLVAASFVVRNAQS